MTGEMQQQQQQQQQQQPRRKEPQSGGATFWPQLRPRPQYPPVRVFLRKLLVAYTRAPALMALATRALLPRYLALVRRLRGLGWGDAKIFAAITCGLHSGLFVLVNGAFFLCEQLGLLEQYRLAHKKAQAPSRKLMLRTLAEAAASQVLAFPLLVHSGFALFRRFGMKDLDAKLPSLWQLYKHFAVAHLFNDFCFYWAHRAVHSKPLYALVHKQHHSWLGTKGIAAEYASPLEQLVANVGPTLGGVLLFGRHPLVVWVWLAFRVQETYEAHSNYYFGNTWLAKLGLTHSENAAFHSAHHSVNRGNFGMWHWDWLFGTMDAYIAEGDTEGYVSKRLGKHQL